jgi:ATP-binding cassette subfamily C (CFTR/MRP) protein 4
LLIVDAEVGRHLFDHCICGILKEKTRILVTHQLQLLQSVQQILVLQDGRIAARGTYNEIITSDEYLKPTQFRARLSSLQSASFPMIRAGSGVLAHGGEVNSLYSMNVEEFDHRSSEPDPDTRTNCTSCSGGSGSFEVGGVKSGPKLNEESVASGRVGVGLYWKYISAGSNCFTAFVLVFSNFLTQALYTGSDYWLSFW